MAYVFKIQVQGEQADLRRISLRTRPSYSELRNYITQIFQARSLRDFAIKYYDDEGDLITIASDLELDCALPALPGGVVRLVVCEANNSQTQQTTSTKRPNFNCPYGFFRGLVEWFLEDDEEATKTIGKLVRTFIKWSTEDGEPFPAFEDLVPMAERFIVTQLQDPKLQEQFPWVRLIDPEEARGLFTALTELPIIREIATKAYRRCQERHERLKQRSAPVPAPAPAPAPVVDPLADATEQEREYVRQLVGMGFTDEKRCLETIRNTGGDLWETVSILSD